MGSVEGRVAIQYVYTQSYITSIPLPPLHLYLTIYPSDMSMRKIRSAYLVVYAIPVLSGKCVQA
jgi:hypothetical protein